jgi:hypothetical protein
VQGYQILLFPILDETAFPSGLVPAQEAILPGTHWQAHPVQQHYTSLQNTEVQSNYVTIMTGTEYLCNKQALF